MAQQTINVGASANDGTGSPLRTAFQYTNSNFTELYAALGGGTGLPGSSGQVLYNNGTAIAGDAGMTYNPTTDTMSLVNLVLSGTFAARNGDTPSSIRAAASDYAAVTFDGATAGTRITSTMTSQAFSGTGDFTVWSRFRVPVTNTGNNSIILGLSDSSISTSTANSFYIVINTAGGELTVVKRSAANGFQNAFNVSGFSTTYAGQIVDLVVTRVAGAWKCYINGTDATPGTTNFAGESVSFTYCHVGLGAAAQLNTRVYRSVVFNRALSASDVTELITTGVNPADQWGTQTQVIGYNPAVLNGGFETNLLNASGTWATSANGTSTATIDTSGSFSRTGTNAGKLTLDGSGSFAAFQASNSSATLLALSKRYRISIWARKGAASGACGIQFGPSAAGSIYGNSGLVLTTSYSNTLVEVVTSVDGGFSMSRLAGSAGLSEIYIDDVELTRIGAIVDLDYTVGTGYQATDRSTNNLHGTLFNGVEFTVPRRMAVLYATTSFNGDTLVLGSNLSIPTNAIIEDIICNSSGTATVSIGTAPAGTTIVNAASVVAGRQKLTIGTPFSSNGTLYVKSNSAAVLQFTILYTIAA